MASKVKFRQLLFHLEPAALPSAPSTSLYFFFAAFRFAAHRFFIMSDNFLRTASVSPTFATSFVRARFPDLVCRRCFAQRNFIAADIRRRPSSDIRPLAERDAEVALTKVLVPLRPILACRSEISCSILSCSAFICGTGLGMLYK